MKWKEYRHKPRNLHFTDMEEVSKSSKRKFAANKSKKIQKSKQKKLRKKTCLETIKKAKFEGDKYTQEAVTKLYVSCTRKESYPTFESAKAKAIFFKFKYKSDYWVYKCHFGDHYHLCTHPIDDETTLWGTAPITEDNVSKTKQRIIDPITKELIPAKDSDIKTFEELNSGENKRKLQEKWSITFRSIEDIKPEEKFICVSVLSGLYVIQKDEIVSLYIDNQIIDHLTKIPTGKIWINHLSTKTIWKIVKGHPTAYIWNFNQVTGKYLSYLKEYDTMI